MKLSPFILIGFILATFSVKAQTYAASNFTLISVISPETYTNSYGAKYSGCWGWYQANKNKEYAIAGSAAGTFWVDVTVPSTPTVCAFRAGKKTNTVWRRHRRNRSIVRAGNLSARPLNPAGRIPAGRQK